MSCVRTLHLDGELSSPNGLLETANTRLQWANGSFHIESAGSLTELQSPVGVLILVRAPFPRLAGIETIWEFWWVSA
jgi:hypothetical protein